MKIYTDEGISGLNTKHREGFNAMIRDALAVKIGLIVTKSVSRFSSNTVDTLTAIRELKAHGVEVYFQKENIYTFDGKGELIPPSSLPRYGSWCRSRSRTGRFTGTGTAGRAHSPAR